VLLISFNLSANCFDEVATKYQIKADLLRAIAFSESSYNANALNCANTNKSCDYGFAQINVNEWKNKLTEFDITLLDLQNPCQNLHFGAWILAQNFKSHGRNWNSVGAYNAGFLKSRQGARDRYIKLVKSNLSKINSNTL